MSGEHLHGSKQNGVESEKITDLAASEGKPTSRADVELPLEFEFKIALRSVDRARVRVQARSDSNLRSAWAATFFTVAGAIVGGLVSIFAGSHASTQVIIYLGGAVLVAAFGTAIGLFLSSRRDRHEETALDNLADVLRQLPPDETSASEVSAEDKAIGDRDV